MYRKRTVSVSETFGQRSRAIVRDCKSEFMGSGTSLPLCYRVFSNKAMIERRVFLYLVPF